MYYSIMTTAMTLRRLGCALCMPFICPFRSPFRPYNRAYAYRGLSSFVPLSMAVSDGCGAVMSAPYWYLHIHQNIAAQNNGGYHSFSKQIQRLLRAGGCSSKTPIPSSQEPQVPRIMAYQWILRYS
ncbi:MAG: hypothetical protein KZQ60_01805 [Candidatus Thiodiazotropha sp. (ex Lucinoma aequizonata)]|nr:hypothetical protein [Candidatus Thiodiazotropha sp. (ex Lucinoma aequizonata)]